MDYNIGIYTGSFLPLHLGHVDCILQAANQCCHLYIILRSDSEHDPIDFKYRYRWLYTITKHLKSIKIIAIDCSSNELTKQDADTIIESIDGDIDVVFCDGEQNESDFRNYFPESDVIAFPAYKVSAKEILSQPYVYWEHIAKPAQIHFVRRVLMVGGESGGKSTLSINLAHHYNTNYIEEAGRELSFLSGTDKLMLQEDYTVILLQQKINEINAINTSNRVLFIDTEALVTQFYLNFLEGDSVSRNVFLSNAIDSVNDFDLILFLEPDVQFVQDGTRNVEIQNHRLKYSEQIKQLLKDHGRPFLSIHGTYQERYEQAVRLVDELLGL